MVNITNPIDEKLELIYKGNKIALEEKETKAVSSEVASFFKGIYSFLIISEIVEKKKVEKKIEVKKEADEGKVSVKKVKENKSKNK